MKLVSRAAGVAISTAALVTLVAPAASASHRSAGELRVCVNGLDRGDEADVDIDGRRADRSAEFRGCRTFVLPRGTYEVRVDAPWGYEAEDDDAWVNVRSGSRTTVRFWLEEDDWHWDGNRGDGDGWDGDRRADDQWRRQPGG